MTASLLSPPLLRVVSSMTMWSGSNLAAIRVLSLTTLRTCNYWASMILLATIKLFIIPGSWFASGLWSTSHSFCFISSLSFFFFCFHCCLKIRNCRWKKQRMWYSLKDFSFAAWRLWSCVAFAVLVWDAGFIIHSMVSWLYIRPIIVLIWLHLKSPSMIHSLTGDRYLMNESFRNRDSSFIQFYSTRVFFFLSKNFPWQQFQVIHSLECFLILVAHK